MKYNFDEIVDRRNTQSIKWNVKDNELPMWVADMDFKVLPEVKEAIHKRIDVDAYGYTSCPDEYFLAYKKWWKRHHNLDIELSEMTFCTGVVAAIDSILKHLLPKCSGVVIQTPVYHVFARCIAHNAHKVVNNPLIYENGSYSVDFDNLDKALGSAKAFILCNPHNPVGRIWSKEELTKIVSLCEKHNVLLISDEIHCDIVEPGYSYTPILSLTDKAIALVAPSKVFNLAALQASCVMCRDKNLLERIEEGLGQDDVGEPNYIACAAATAAFTYGDEWVKEMNEYVFHNKQYLKEFVSFNLPGAHLVDNRATYLLWLDLSKYTNDIEAFANNLRKETGLLLTPGKQFGDGGEGFVRINVATSLANVKDACERLLKYIKTLQK